ncbi:MAG: nitrogen regulation protein NR(II) [Hahellaceae bacterium]|jgi:two-component system nitrogen regulation sensor histidine kinase GlnL|nr:nitrogen regulation protein NR(II) [Hahellaceae bacterium]
MFSNSFFKPLLESMSTAILVLDERLGVVFSNQASEILLETTGQRAKGLSITDLLKEQVSALTGLEECLRNGNSYTQREAEIRTAGGNRITIDYTVTAFSPGGQTWILMELSGRDRLQRISREEELIANQETSKILVRGLAHEIKNPLGGIRGAAQLLSRALTDPSLQDYTEIIISESDRLRNLVDRMLGPHQAMRIERTNIHEVLERVLSLIEVECGGKIRLVRDYDPSIPEFLGDKEQLIQAFLNVARNAMQALESTPPERSPQISFRTRPVRQLTLGHTRHRLVLRIDITDNGPGIPEDLQKNMFYPMVSGRAEGTGLGLSITQNIVSRHHGLVECESIPGKTNFIFFIPLEIPS